MGKATAMKIDPSPLAQVQARVRHWSILESVLGKSLINRQTTVPSMDIKYQSIAHDTISRAISNKKYFFFYSFATINGWEKVCSRLILTQIIENLPKMG